MSNSNLNRTPSGAPGATHPKAAVPPPPGSPTKFRSLSRDPDVGRRQHSAEERVRHGPKMGVALERVALKAAPTCHGATAARARRASTTTAACSWQPHAASKTWAPAP